MSLPLSLSLSLSTSFTCALINNNIYVSTCRRLSSVIIAQSLYQSYQSSPVSLVGLMKCPEVSSHGENRALYRIAGIIKGHSRVLRRKLEIKRASHTHCNHLATLHFIAISAEMLLKMAVNKMSNIRRYICFILYYMYMVYIVYICCKQCH